MSDALTSQQDQLDAAISSMHYWSRRAQTLEATAADMRRVARGLERETDKLYNLFLPLRLVHTASTWEGNAATLSRQRLDGHEAQFNAALQMINGLITELTSGASTTSASASTARRHQEQHRQTAYLIEVSQLDNEYA